MSNRQNITRIKVVNNILAELSRRVVFVGGATVSLYSDRPSLETRPTDDIDILIELLNYNEFTDLEKRLRAKGFANDMTSKMISRYKVQGIVVDIMPTTGNVLGFSNKWYPDGYANSICYEIDDRHTIRILTSTYFVATKLEAFKNRGKNDGRTSTDFEDIVFVLNNRSTIWEELNASNNELKEYLNQEFSNILQIQFINEWITAHLEFNEQKRGNYILEGLKNFLAN